MRQHFPRRSIRNLACRKQRQSFHFKTHKFKSMKKLRTIGERYSHAITKALLIMKLTTVILLAAALQVSAKAGGQNITLKLDQVEIARVLNTIEKQGAYRFLYNSQLKDIRQKVSIDVANTGIQDVMKALLATTNLTYKVLENNLVVVLANTPDKQDIKITGKVTGDNNLPLSGVSVTLKGTSRGTTTDNEGNYTLTVPEDGTLLVSYIGYEPQEVAVKSQSVVNITLAPANKQMEQVVVVGYGTQRKKDVTGSISTIRGEEISRQPVLSADQALQSKAAGVEVSANGGRPGASPVVRIRGIGTVGNSNPLYVVDGMFVDDIKFLNPGDIASIEVLKDASSLAIYGVRGANGVIIITTKSGRGAKSAVTFDTYYGFTELAKKIDMVNAREYATLTNEAIANSNKIFGRNDPPRFADPNAFGAGTDWMDEIFQKGPIRNHQLSISGSSDKGTYNLSVGYFDQEGILKGSAYNRWSIKFNNTYKVYDFLRIGTNIAISRYVSDNMKNDIVQNAYVGDPTIPVRNADGSYGFSPNKAANPVAQIDNTMNESKGGRLVGNAFAEVRFLKNFTFKSSYGVDMGYNQFYNYENGVPTGVDQIQQRTKLTKGKDNFTTWLWENTLNYNRRFNDHRLDVLAGVTAQESKSEALEGSRMDVPGYSSDVMYLRLGNPTSANNNDGASVYTYLSYLFRTNYTFKDRYLLTFSMRADGSSRFPTNNRYGYFPAVGVGWVISDEAFMQNQKAVNNLKLRASYGVLGNTNIPDYLYYARISSGQNASFGSSGNMQQGGTVTNPVASDLLWERVKQLDIGLEATTLDNRLYLEVDYYNRKTEDMVLKVDIGNGLQIQKNAASAFNRGWEFTARWNDKIGKHVDYSFSGNLTTVKNEVTDLGNGGIPIRGGGLILGGRTATLTDIGMPIGAFYGYKVEGVFQTDQEAKDHGQEGARAGDLRFADMNGNKKIEDSDRVMLGTAIPKVFWGLSSSWAYKGFEITFDLQGSHGNKIFNGKKSFRLGGENYEKSVWGRWTGPGSTNTEPWVTNGGQNYEKVSDYYLENASFVRIRNIQLAYNFPQSVLKTLHLQNLRVYVSGQNLFTFTDYSGFSPEVGGEPSPGLGDPAFTRPIPGVVYDPALNRGVDLSVIPVYRTFIVGINIGL